MQQFHGRPRTGRPATQMNDMMDPDPSVETTIRPTTEGKTAIAAKMQGKSLG